MMMTVAIDVPEDIASQLEARWGDMSQRILEAFALEAYRSGEITEAQVQRMLHLSSRWEVEAFLKRTQAYLEYTEADLEQDILTIRQVTSR